MPIFLKSNFFCLFFFLGLAVFIPTTSSASVPKPAGIVTQVAGQATLHRVGLTDALPVKFRDRVFLQDKIHTQERTFVRVLLGGKALVTVGELSVLTITEDLDHATIDIESGTVGLSVARKRMKPGEYIEIRTPHAIAAVRGTTVLTQVTTLTNMSVLEGFIDIAGIATPNQTVTLTQLTALKATGQGLGPLGKMSPEDIKIAHKHLQTIDDAPPEDSPLSDSVAEDQSIQAALLAEALAPASDEEESKLQTEESELGESNPDSDSSSDPLTPKDLKTNLIVPPNETINSSKTFLSAVLSGGTVDGSGTLTVERTTTVTGGTNIVNNPYNSKGKVSVNGGSVNFKGGGTHDGGFESAANTILEFGGGTHNISNDVKGAGTVLVSGGEVNINGGTYNITGNSTSVTGGIMTFNNGATLTSLGPLSVSGGLINFLNSQLVSLSTFNFSGGTVSGTQTVTATGITTVTGLGTKTITAPFNNEGPLTLEGGTLRLLGGGNHNDAISPGSFTTKDGTTLEFGGGTHQVAGSSISGPGTVSVTAGELNTDGNLFELTADLSTQNTVFQQTGGKTTINGGDALGVGTHSLNASEATDALFDISGGTFTTEGDSNDLIESRSGGGTVTTGGSAVALSGTGSMTLKGASSSILQSFGAGTTITTGKTAVTVSGNAVLDLDDQSSNDVALIQSGGELYVTGAVIETNDSALVMVGQSVGKVETGGQLTTTTDVALLNGGTLAAGASILSVSGSSTVNVGRSVGRVNGGQLTTTNGGHVLESTGGTTTMGDSILDLIGSTSQADISGYVVSATGGQINGPDSNLVNVDAGELNTNGGIIKADGDDRIILDNGTSDAIVDITSSDGTHDLGTTSGEAIFNLSGTSSTDTPLTKKDGGNNDIAVDQTLLRTSGATVTAKRLLKIDQALLDATAVLFQFLAGSDVTVDPGTDNGAIGLTMQAKVTSTMPLLTLDNSTLTLTTGHLLALNQSQFSVMGDFISLNNGSSLNLQSANGFLVSATGNSTLTITGAFINFGGTGGNTITLANTSFTETISGINFFFTGGATNAQVTVNGTPIQNSGLGTITPGAGYIQVDGTQATVTIQGS